VDIGGRPGCGSQRGSNARRVRPRAHVGQPHARTTAAAILGGNNSGGATNPASGLSAAILYWDVRNLAAYLIANVSVRGAMREQLLLIGGDVSPGISILNAL
jgi:hypothetical protein